MLITEIVDNKLQILIIYSRQIPLIRILKDNLSKYNAECFLSNVLPDNSDIFDYIFIVDQHPSKQILKFNRVKKIIYVFVSNNKKAAATAKWLQDNHARNAKVINLPTNHPNESEIEKILWFGFSASKEVFLNLAVMPTATKKPRPPKSSFTFRRGIIYLFTAILVFSISIIPLAAASSYLFYGSFKNLGSDNVPKSQRLLSYGSILHNLTAGSYILVKPLYLFLSLSLLPDNIISANTKTANILNRSIELYNGASNIQKLLLKKNKTESEELELLTHIRNSEIGLKDVENNLLDLSEKVETLPLPKTQALTDLKSDLKNNLKLVKKVRQIFPHLPSLLAHKTEKKYLLLFANNMELRPGGGFIGSYGVLTMRNLTLEEINVFDVYDADGQLKEHIEPPSAIRRHLAQPNWFLRDSAFSSDFSQNYDNAKIFLDKEVGLNSLAGGVLITTSAIQNILEGFESLHLSDFDETVTKNNFYLKAQHYAESKFFPGSIQKKSFLGSLTQQILVNLETASLPKLMTGFKTSLDEKQIVLAVEDSAVQSVIDKLYWSGKTIVPNCPSTNPCINDYLYPLDANLGVNKANFLVSRTISQRIQIGTDGKISNSLFINFKNDSLKDVFPGGPYKNYFQLTVPKAAIIKNVTKNGVLVENYDTYEADLKTIGFLIEIAPQSTAELKIDYQLETGLRKGQTLYQLIFQKQTGSKNSDLNLEIILPGNVRLLNQNFSPLVKDNRVFYNTNLNADKIFLFELLKQ